MPRSRVRTIGALSAFVLILLGAAQLSNKNKNQAQLQQAHALAVIRWALTTPQPGQNVTFNVTVINIGTSTETTTTIHDTLLATSPAQFVSGTGPTGACSYQGDDIGYHVYSCPQLATLAPGAAQTYQFTYSIPNDQSLCGQKLLGHAVAVNGVVDVHSNNGSPTGDLETPIECQTAPCGDGKIIVGVEECDDGNTQPNDGCSASCMLEMQILSRQTATGPQYSMDVYAQPIAQKGGTLSFTEGITNNGAAAEGTFLDNRVVLSNLTFLNPLGCYHAYDMPGGMSPNTFSTRCEIGTLAAGGSAAFTYLYRIPIDAPCGDILWFAGGGRGGVDASFVNVSDPVKVTIPCPDSSESSVSAVSSTSLSSSSSSSISSSQASSSFSFSLSPKTSSSSSSKTSSSSSSSSKPSSSSTSSSLVKTSSTSSSSKTASSLPPSTSSQEPFFFSASSKRISSSSSSAILKPAAPVLTSSSQKACPATACAEGGDAYCAAQRKVCSTIPDPPCIVCVGRSDSSAMALAVSLSKSSAATIRPQMPDTMCGNGIVEIGEECDDGNNGIFGSHCSAFCTLMRTSSTQTLAQTTVAPAVIVQSASSSSSSSKQTIVSAVVQPQVITAQVLQQYDQPPNVTASGPGSLAMMAAGAAAGVGWMRRRKR